MNWFKRHAKQKQSKLETSYTKDWAWAYLFASDEERTGLLEELKAHEKNNRTRFTDKEIKEAIKKGKAVIKQTKKESRQRIFSMDTVTGREAGVYHVWSDVVAKTNAKRSLRKSQSKPTKV